MSPWTLPRAPRSLLLACLVIGSAGCPTAPAAEADDVDLGTLRLALWQPAALASGDGDLLDDAEDVQVTLRVDGKERTLTLDGALRAEGGEAAPEGSEVTATVRTTGSALPDALARSGLVRLEPGGGDVTVTALLAPPDVPHALSETLPNGRSGMAVCAAEDGRVWAIGGLLGATLAEASFVLDPSTREVREGPGLDARRAYASCVPDDEGGVYLSAGCDDNGTPVGSLSYSATGERGASFVEERSLPNAGCHTRLARTRKGTLVALTGTHLYLVPPGGDGVQSQPLPSARFGAVLAVFPGEGEHVLVGGGFSGAAPESPASGSLLYDLEAGGGPLQIGEFISAAVREGDALVVVGAGRISRLSPDGTLETVHTFSLPTGTRPTQVAPLYDGRYALLDPQAPAVRIVGADATRGISLPARREHLVSEPGGALLLLGGDTPGVSVIVVD